MCRQHDSGLPSGAAKKQGSTLQVVSKVLLCPRALHKRWLRYETVQSSFDAKSFKWWDELYNRNDSKLSSNRSRVLLVLSTMLSVIVVLRSGSHVQTQESNVSRLLHQITTTKTKGLRHKVVLLHTVGRSGRQEASREAKKTKEQHPGCNGDSASGNASCIVPSKRHVTAATEQNRCNHSKMDFRCLLPWHTNVGRHPTTRSRRTATQLQLAPTFGSTTV